MQFDTLLLIYNLVTLSQKLCIGILEKNVIIQNAYLRIKLKHYAGRKCCNLELTNVIAIKQIIF